MPRSPLRDRLVARVIDAATAPVRFALPRFPRAGATSLALTSADGTSLHADVFSPSASTTPAPRGTIVLAHGYRDSRHQLAFLVRPLLARGHRVLALDFRAHGRSAGTRISIGAREAHDVRAALSAARDLEGASGRVAFLGYSMGASAYLLAGVEADVAVLDSPYDTLDGAVTARVRRLGLPTRATARIATALAAEGSRRLGFDLAAARPIDRVTTLTRPTLFVFARQDPWIDASTRASFARALPACASMRVVPGGHKLHFGPGWRASVVAFLTAGT